MMPEFLKHPHMELYVFVGLYEPGLFLMASSCNAGNHGDAPLIHTSQLTNLEIPCTSLHYMELSMRKS